MPLRDVYHFENVLEGEGRWWRDGIRKEEEEWETGRGREKGIGEEEACLEGGKAGRGSHWERGKEEGEVVE